jgi:hypothetical protein
MDKIEAILSEIVKFRNERDWEQFHNSKDLALAISIEAAELNELFLWKQADDVDLQKLKNELEIFSLFLSYSHTNITLIYSRSFLRNFNQAPLNTRLTSPREPPKSTTNSNDRLPSHEIGFFR